MTTVLLLGASGFIGRHVRDALVRAGCEVISGVHAPSAHAEGRSIAVDYMRDHSEEVWLSRLAGVDVVVNAVGILRETRRASFEALHVAAPVALFRACARAGVAKVIQISALGADEVAVSRYHTSKKRADDALAATHLAWAIVQPSLVFGENGRSARMFTALAALPLIPLPGDGEQRVQPIHVEDLSEVIVRLVKTRAHDGKCIAAVGPHALTLRAFLAVLRHVLRLGEAHFLRVPMLLVRAVAAFGAALPGMLLDRETLGMLLRGNVASPAAVTEVLGRAPRAPEAFISPQMARHLAREARLAWLLPLLRASVGIVWIVAGIVSLGVYPLAESYAMLARVGLTGAAASLALYGASAIDLLFGAGVFVLRDRTWLWRAQIALILAYSALIAVFLPEYWLHPFGPVVKNLPLLAAIVMLHELERGSGAQLGGARARTDRGVQ